MLKYEQPGKDTDEAQARSAAANGMWNRLRWLPCIPTLGVSFYALSVLSKTQDKAFWLTLGAFLSNLLWLALRGYRTWKVCKWVKEGQS
jgi:uncharacterized BrkB/YihY/UPF0761 family membrane protein